MNTPELQEILRSLLAEIQHLRVDCALLSARLSGPKTAADLLDIERSAHNKVAQETEALVSKIERLQSVDAPNASL